MCLCAFVCAYLSICVSVCVFVRQRPSTIRHGPKTPPPAPANHKLGVSGRAGAQPAAAAAADYSDHGILSLSNDNSGPVRRVTLLFTVVFFLSSADGYYPT